MSEQCPCHPVNQQDRHCIEQKVLKVEQRRIRTADAIQNPVASKLQRAVKIGLASLERPHRAGKNLLPEMRIEDEGVLKDLRIVVVNEAVAERARKDDKSGRRQAHASNPTMTGNPLAQVVKP